MFAQGNEEKKLDWMYSGANTSVDREEYLLGRSVDKALEELIAKEKQGSTTLIQPKNHVEHECIPPSIRDFKKLQIGDQVDLAQKLQEDPLITIKKREEETRQKLLQNPVQLKKIQRIIRNRSDDKDKQNRSSISAKLKAELLVRHMKTMNHIGVGTVSVEDSLDVLIAKKILSLMKKYTSVDFDTILNMFSDAEDSDNDKKSKKRSFRTSELSDTDKKRKKSKKLHKIKRKKRSKSTDSDTEKSKKTKHSTEKRSHKKYAEKTDSENEMKKKHKSDKSKRYSDSDSSSNDRSKKSKHSQRVEKNKKSLPSTRVRKDSTSSASSSDSSTTDSDIHYNSDEQKKHHKKQHYGLVRPDGSKIRQSKTVQQIEMKKTEDTSKSQKETSQVKHGFRKPLTGEELEKRRREMLQNAEWRDTEREKNIRRYREADSKEQKNYEYSADFIKKELLKSANSSTVESRIKANINNIQRSRNDMNTHFSRR